jgi:prevent-host-death family protein
VSTGQLFAAAVAANGQVTMLPVMTVQSLAAVKAQVSQIVDAVAGTHERVTVAKNGSPVSIILAVEDQDSLRRPWRSRPGSHGRGRIRQAESQMSRR